MKAIFLDFDGVICNSIDECFQNSSEIFWGFSTNYSVDLFHKEAFYKFRGLVRPVYQYFVLHRSITIWLENKLVDFKLIFDREDLRLSESDKLRFENLFFFNRSLHKKNIGDWLKQNQLTEFGETLVNRNLANYFIITTKDRESVTIINSHHNIEIDDKRIFDKEDYRKFGTKGRIIEHVMKLNGYSEAYFLDDSVEHLDTAKDISNLKCFFVPWGYGENTIYDNFTFNKTNNI